jgi:hypothetical protein
MARDRTRQTVNRRGVFMPHEQAESYIAVGWILIDDLTPHHVLVLPPKAVAPQKLDRSVSYETGGRMA